MSDDLFSQAVRNFAGLKNEAAKPIRLFSEKLPRLRTAAAVIDWLDEAGRPFGLDQAHGIWELPTDFKNQIDRWYPGENVFWSRKVPPEFWPSYKKQHRLHGPSALALMARRTSEPFTFQEAEAEAERLRWRTTWVFDEFRNIDFVDGLYCTSRRWAACWVSRTQVAIGPEQRMFLQAYAIRAFGRLEKLNLARSRHRTKKNGLLTERVTAVLQARALYGSNREAATLLNMSPATLKVHLANARRKLKKTDTIQLFLTALKEGIIDY